MQLGQIGSAVSDLSQAMAQALRLPSPRPARTARPGRVRVLPRAGTGGRGLRSRVLGTLWLVAGTLPDEMAVDMIRQAGGRSARAVVVPAAAYGGAEAGERYRRYLRRFGMEQVETVPASTRTQAADVEAAGRLAGADLILLAGGHRDLLLDVFRGSPAAEAVAQVLGRGGAVAACGAAAEAAGAWVFADGASAPDAAPQSGLDLLPDTLVAAAPHGSGRIAALFGLALQTGLQVLLLDERTVVAVRPGWQADVRSGVALAVGAPPEPRREAEPRRGRAAPPERSPVGGLWTRVAPAGWSLDLTTRALLPPGGQAPAHPGT